MRRSAASAAFAVFCALSLSPAAAQPQPAKSRAAIEEEILGACIQEGGKLKECLCGIGIAREGLTDRQYQLFPILWPIVNGKGSTGEKLVAGLTALEQNGYTASDGFALIAAIQAHAGRVERECSEPAPPEQPAQ